MLSLTRQAIVNSIQKRDCIRGNVLDIQCEDVDAITFKDIIELYLLLCRVKNWQWSGPLEGQSAARQSFAVICANLVRDIVSWPFIYLKHLRRVSRLSGQTGVTAALTDVTSILFLRSDHWFNIRSGGSVGHLRGVIYGFRSLGCKVNVVSSDVLMGVEASRDFYLCAPGYALGRNVPNVPELLYNDRLSEFIEKKWEELAISFVYQRYSLGNYTGVLLRKKYGVPYVCEYNGSFSWVSIHWEGRKLFHDKLLTRIEMLNLQAADLIVVVSRALYDELVSRGISPNKILVNPNGVDPEKYLPEVDGSAIRTKYGLEDKTVIGFIGTFGQWHGAEVLAEAFGRLIRSFPEYREKVCLFMIGDGPTMPLVKEILAKYSVADACVLTGRIPQESGPAHLAACDILASPHVPNPDGTPFFGSPTKLFEYMAMGKGIVASDLDQIGEILKHEKTAWMVKPGDAVSLMSGLKKLIDDRPLREGMGKAAREEVVANYTWKEHTRKIIDKLREVMISRIHK